MRRVVLLLVCILGCWGCNSRPQEEIPTSGSVEQSRQENGKIQQERRDVEIYDQGLNLVISTVTLPRDWTLQQDIASNPSTGLPVRYKYVFIGPKNQYIRNYAATFPFGQMFQISYEQAQQDAIDHILGPEELEDLSFSAFEPATEILEEPETQRLIQRGKTQGNLVEIYKTSFNGYKNGKEYAGLVYLMSMFNPNGGFGVLVPASLLFSPAEFLEDALDASTQIVKSRKPNPEYEQAMGQIRFRNQQQHQQQMDQLAAAHQRRMADQKAAFASHQKNMAGLNQLQDVAHESYMTSLRSSGSFSSVGSDFDSHNKTIDQIHERQSFQDPWTQQTISLDGQYEYNFTNGLGDYYRTNDASFDYNSLNGDWKPIQDLNQ